MDFPLKNGGSFHSYVNVYQRVNHHYIPINHYKSLEILMVSLYIPYKSPINHHFYWENSRFQWPFVGEWSHRIFFIAACPKHRCQEIGRCTSSVRKSCSSYTRHSIKYEGFQSMRVAQNEWFVMEHPHLKCWNGW